MASTATIRVNERHVLLVNAAAGTRRVFPAVTFATSDATKVAIEKSHPDRCVVRGVAAGNATITVTVTGGGQQDTCVVTVIADDAVSTITLSPGR